MEFKSIDEAVAYYEGRIEEIKQNKSSEVSEELKKQYVKALLIRTIIILGAAGCLLIAGFYPLVSLLGRCMILGG